MTAGEFRELALSLAGATESSHMNHPDFRAHGRIFATLGYPDAGWGMVKLPLDEQKRYLELHPQVFVPAKGAWGLQGSTMVRLEAAQRDVLAPALDLAWQNSAAPVAKKKSVAKKTPKKSASRARP
jgi:hypothetical protein